MGCHPSHWLIFFKMLIAPPPILLWTIIKHIITIINHQPVIIWNMPTRTRTSRHGFRHTKNRPGAPAEDALRGPCRTAGEHLRRRRLRWILPGLQVLPQQRGQRHNPRHSGRIVCVFFGDIYIYMFIWIDNHRYIYIYMSMYLYLHIYIYIYLSIYLYIYISISISIATYLYMYNSIFYYLYKPMYMYIYVYAGEYIYICMYMYASQVLVACQGFWPLFERIVKTQSLFSIINISISQSRIAPTHYSIL